MSILFGLVGLVIMLAIGVGLIIGVIAMARKSGMLSTFDKQGEGQEEGSFSQNFQWLKNSIFWRFVLVAILIALMTIPMNMVEDVVNERRGLPSQPPCGSNAGANARRRWRNGGCSCVVRSPAVGLGKRVDVGSVVVDRQLMRRGSGHLCRCRLVVWFAAVQPAAFPGRLMPLPVLMRV